MAGNSQPNETLTRNYIRAFTQRGGPGPSVEVRYAGAQEQYLMMGDISRPDRGGITALNVNDPHRRGLFKRSGITIDAPDIPSNTVTFRQFFNGVPWYQFKLDCPVNIYQSYGQCQDPSDFLNGWVTLMIASQGLSTDKTYAGLTPFDESDVTTTDVGFSWTGDVYTIGGIALGEQGSSDATTEVVDVTYGGYQNCANCGVPNDGTKWIYALQQTAGGSSAVNAKVLYNTNYGLGSWSSSAITGLAVGSLVKCIKVVGNYLVVLCPTEDAYFISTINSLTGAPGTWTKVSTGFVAANTPNDMYVESPSRVYFCGDGGYIYVSTNIAAGVSVLNAGSATTNNLNRIHGDSGVLIAVGASGTVIKSINKGVAWSTTTTQLSGTLQAAAVRSQYSLWAGNSAGTVSYSDDQGETWTTLSTLPGSAPSAGIYDIVWASAEVGYICATRTGPTAVIFGTYDGGRSWADGSSGVISSRFPATPTYGRPNRLAFPLSPDIMVATNNIAVAGLSGGLTDGVILIGAAPVL